MSEPLTVIHIIPFLHFGAGRHVANTIASLAATGGFEQYLVTAGAADDLSDDPGMIFETSPHTGGHIVAGVFKRDIPELAAAASDIAVLVSSVRGKRVVLHTYTGVSCFCASAARGLLGGAKQVRIAATLMGGSPEKSEFHKNMDAWAVSHADIALPISEAVLKIMELEGVPAGMQRVIYPGIDIASVTGAAVSREEARAESGLAPDDEVVGTVSQLSPRKGVDYLLRAFKIVAEKRQNAKLILVGRGHPDVDIRAMASELEISDRVVAAGEASSQYRAMCAMDVFSMTSTYEGLGLALVEAQALGRPAVCFDSGGMPETISGGKTGFTVPFGDVETLAEKIVLLLSDKQLYLSMSSEGRGWVSSRFDLCANTAALAEVYEGLFA